MGMCEGGGVKECYVVEKALMGGRGFWGVGGGGGDIVPTQWRNTHGAAHRSTISSIYTYTLVHCLEDRNLELILKKYLLF